ncbi:hypothetical protein GP486_007245 [Trichoglossum hirsutum]|uniref:Uncharacterized protein n=1 Tax=Trichoglossum hirsutum TaxID=265104 RepID=A0A9P8IC47_9PEZI|nr:hypothetical protein GP486_007245 [Trichoglossum hirsutum]
MDASTPKLKRRASDADDGDQSDQPRLEQKNSPTSIHPPSAVPTDVPELESFHHDRGHVTPPDQSPTRSRANASLDRSCSVRSNEDHEMLDFPVRMPTPMHGSFFPHSSHHGNSDVAMGDGGDNSYVLGHPQYHGHRLPSPISEGEDKIQRFEANGEAMEIVEDDSSSSNSGSAAVSNKASHRKQGSRLVDGRIPPAAVFGKGKVMFSMGYRADCEKCRDMVPGHYSHFVRT